MSAESTKRAHEVLDRLMKYSFDEEAVVVDAEKLRTHLFGAENYITGLKRRMKVLETQNQKYALGIKDVLNATAEDSDIKF